MTTGVNMAYYHFPTSKNISATLVVGRIYHRTSVKYTCQVLWCVLA